MSVLGRWLRTSPIWLLPAALLVVLLFGKLVDPPPLRLLQLAVFDGLQRLGPRAPSALPLRVVDIDDASVARVGQWPWPRDVLARLIDALHDGGASAVVLDTLFAEPDRTSPARVFEALHVPGLPADLPDHDRMLAAALERIPTIGGFAFAESAAATPPRLFAGFGVSGPDPKPYLPTFATAVTDLPEIEAALRGYGAFNALPDIDGVTRRVPMLFAGFDHVYPSLVAESLRVLVGDSSYKLKTVGGSGEAGFGAHLGLVGIRLGTGDGAITIPTDANGAVAIHFGWPRPERTVSAWRLIETPSSVAVADQVVFVGSSATGLGDIRLTPLGYMPGVEVQAQALEQVLTGDYLVRPDWAEGLELTVIAVAGILMLWVWPRVRPVTGAALGGVLIALFGGAAWIAFARWHFEFDPVYPAVCMTALYGATTLLTFMRAESDRAFVRNALSRYTSPKLVAQLTPESLKLGGARREMSFIFTDIAGFTTLSEQLGPARVAQLLNPYFDELCNIIIAQDGTVNEFIGDAVLAFFGAPVEQADHAARAVRAARALDQAAERFRKAQNAAGIGFGITRIGVHTGSALVGNFGAFQRMKYAALGDVVNTASRIEGLNKHFATRVCASRALFDLAGDVGFRPLGRVVVKGRHEELEIVELLDDARAASSQVARYREAYAALEQGDAEAAKALLETLAAEDPADGPVALHLRRLAEGARDARIVMTEK